jgi:uncharacterized protein YyaL (SSP411 family)
MKKFLILLGFLATFLGAAELQKEPGYAQAISRALELNRPVVLVVSSHDCHYCDVFDSETLADAMVIEALNRDFVTSVVYASESGYIPRELFTGATPTIWFLLPDGTPMYDPVMGAVGKEDFIKALAIVHNEFGKTQQSGD